MPVPSEGDRRDRRYRHADHCDHGYHRDDRRRRALCERRQTTMGVPRRAAQGDSRLSGHLSAARDLDREDVALCRAAAIGRRRSFGLAGRRALPRA
jgi:hypothetical protein